jgi:simple sugar transport system permease protein
MTRRAIGFGLFTIGLGVVALFAFGLGSSEGLRSTLVLSPRDGSLIDITLASRTSGLVFAGVLLGLGVLQVVRRIPGEANALLALALLLFVVALLTWAARGDTTSVFGLLQVTLRRSIPLALGALAGVLCERAGVINIAIEGMLLAGAFTGAIVGSAADNLWIGLLGGAVVGGLLGLLLAWLAIRFKVDQIIGGTVINILALGLTSFLTARVLVHHPDLNRPGAFRPFSLPLVDKVPVLGPLLFRNTIFVYLEFLLVGVVWWGLFRTRWGLRLRAVGEHPRAADTVGIRVLATRYRAVVLGGVVAGVAGTYFTLDATGGFDENMSAGRGFIALAALIFGRWNPVGAFGAALVFGFAEELQGRLALLDTPIPSNFLLMLPYVVTLVVVAGLIGRSRPPKADGIPYETGD